MSLVDYASSSDDDEERQEQNLAAEEQQAKVSTYEQSREENKDFEEEVLQRHSEATINQLPAPKFDPSHSHAAQNHNNMRLDSTVNKQGKEVSEHLEAPALKLPDASLLLNSPALPSNQANSTDHSSRVAAAMAESESRKRDLNGSSSSNLTRNKVPRGNLPHSKRVPDTVGGHLLPPQLTGRSNIVTEDISKLFLKRRDSSI